MPDNALLDFSDLPRFDLFNHEHVTPAIDVLLTEARQLVNALETSNATDMGQFCFTTRICHRTPWSRMGCS